MWHLPNKNLKFDLDIPPVCTNQPEQGSAFCECHTTIAKNMGIPTGLRKFLKYCGVQGILRRSYELNV